MAVEVLELIPIFRGVDNEDLAFLAAQCRTQEYDCEDVVFAQGDKAVMLYILLSGKVGIRYKPYDGESLNVAEIQPGEIFGWSAVLRRPTYTSAAIAIIPSRAVAVSGSGLRRLCRARPAAGEVILQRLVEVIPERLKDAHSQVVQMLQESMQPTAEDE
jgi:CRP-like cAMP-binding protein